jgi:hypothetical protein
MVLISPGTHSRNSIQLMRSISGVLGDCCSAAEAVATTKTDKRKTKPGEP